MRFAPLVPKPKPSDFAKLKVKREPALANASISSSALSDGPSPERWWFGDHFADAEFERSSGNYPVRNYHHVDDNPLAATSPGEELPPGWRTMLPGRRLPKLEVGDPASLDSSLLNFKYGAPAFLAKLEVGGVDDPLERQADEIADEVMRMPPTAAELDSVADQRALHGPQGFVAQRQCASCEAEGDERLTRVMTEPVLSRAWSTCADEDKLRRTCASCDAEDELLHACASCDPAAEQIRRVPGAGLRGGGVSDSFAALVRGRVRLGGSPLSSGVRSFLEPRFGVELERVRVHANVDAGTLARKIDARAFTFGKDIFFAPGELRPQTHSGMRLLAHEVAHTLQQNQATSPARSLRADTVIHRAPPEQGATAAPTVAEKAIPNGVQVRADLVDTPKWRTPRMIAALLISEIEIETTIEMLFNVVMEKLDSDPDLKLAAVREFLESFDPALVDKILTQPGGRSVLRGALALAQSDPRDTFAAVGDNYKRALRAKKKKKKKGAVELHSQYLVPSAVLAPWAAPDSGISKTLDKAFEDILTCRDDTDHDFSVQVAADSCGEGFTATNREFVCMNKVQYNLESLLGASVVKEMQDVVRTKYPGEDTLNSRNMEALVGLGRAVRIFSTGDAQENKSSCKRSIEFDAASYDPTERNGHPFVVTGEGVYAKSPEQAMLDATKDAKAGTYVFIASVQQHHTVTLMLEKAKAGALVRGSGDYTLFWSDQYTDQDAFGNVVKGQKIHGVALAQKIFRLAEPKFRTPARPGSALERIMTSYHPDHAQAINPAPGATIPTPPPWRVPSSKRDRELVAQRCANNHGVQIWMILPRQPNE